MEKMKWRLKFFVFAMAFLTDMCWTCPTACVCKWKNGKQTVECGDKSLLIIPEGMDSGTQVLEFSGNNLRTLHREKFFKMDLINLQRIYLARCHILVIEPGTFKGLTNLVELDLSANAMETVPTAAFHDCPSLMKLTLSANPIKVIHREAFGYLYFLHTLELSGCQLVKVDAGALDGLQSLERLRLDGNLLTTIDSAGTMSKHLQEVDLQGNQWQCDCRMAEMRSWLETYELPTSVAPLCAGPPRFAKRPVKSIPRAELACLPDVTPTMFYLEIAEGKNISLQCQISAVPEAHVSWWFQGQLLQNDTMLTPDTRLIYYVEEGGEDKRSELFIYNTNPNDNGTFVCVAENPAGVVQSNFTIRILLNNVPTHEFAQLPFEFVLIIVSATGVSLIVICFALVLSIIKCHSEKRRRKKEEGRENLVLSHSTKDSLLQDSVEEFSELSKESSAPTLVQVQQQIIFYNGTPTSQDVLRSVSPILAANQMRNPAPLAGYQAEQNPDLISDAENLGIGKRHDGDGEDKHASSKYDEAALNIVGENVSSKHLATSVCYRQPAVLPPVEEPGCNHDLYRLSADVHLNPVGLLSAAHFTNGICYRTLPYNRGVKRQASLQETYRYQRDAEFSTPRPPFEQFHPANVRYTADGYPARGCCEAEQETQFSDTESLRSCCSAPAMPWAPHAAVPTPLVSILKHSSDDTSGKKCGAQTQTDITALNQLPTVNPKLPNRTVAIKIAETLTESPDEGYEGEENQAKI